jgi:hypothetical protein
MSTQQNKSRRPRLSSIAYDAARTIRLNVGDDGDFDKDIYGPLIKLAELAGFRIMQVLHPTKWRERPSKVGNIFIEAMRAAYDLSDKHFQETITPNTKSM